MASTLELWFRLSLGRARLLPSRCRGQQLLDEELQQLPEASRAPLVLFYLDGKTQTEIAQQLGLSVEAVEGRLR